ncbi:hypothetical protein SUGI_0919330 [Cryptomeria japonica]|uniref:probably inactive leucine-rich repeat receptor-like protein kinase At5g48380 n=1 Tax=Cryptomeria japonica TaxID=3369 RepID=UPI002414AFBC|nr:probably inactive leucine-rich repeat receptor-like protein kinase At5g48380 [Cryptomeria japonica]GLJ44080.1 hypothetical protein SUGI_0919330 [Cryptomeria japonica]
MGKSIGLFLAKVIVSVVPLLSLLLIQGSATETDIQCLKTLKRNLKDPNDYLSTWKFENLPEGYICNFVGVDCWHPNENRVLNIKLPGMGLEGDFPLGFNYCTTMTGLDLSDNKFTGPIPVNLPKWIQYLTSLDLSQNNFVGTIPREVANLTYLNILHLQSNQLTGQIPWELTRLERLKEFNVANNRLSGQIPTFVHKFEADNFNNNSDLCGVPLRNCNETLPAKKKSPVIATAASVTGVSVFFLIGYSVWWFFIRSEPKEIVTIDESKWAERIKGQFAKVSMFEKPVSKISLADLMVATNEFSTENIIGTGRTGTMYKATLPDGSILAIKRLQPSAQTDKKFKSEMITLGQLHHRNLVPLLGYCVAKGEKLLVYMHMPNGTLYEKLHVVESDGNSIDWPKRLKIAIGAARGLAWLHHSCNPRVIHRNVSSKCILLNEDYEPRITDFGLARLMNPVDTHLSTFVNGDFGDLGYVAPEYMRTLVATLKGDVFSFGVVLLELVTGQKPVEVENIHESFKGNLVDWISYLSKHGNVQEAIDKALIGRGYDEELLQVLKVATNCVLSPHKERPSMYEVYHLLRAIGENYNFSDQYDDIPLVSDTAERDYSNELIVAIEPK